LIIVYLIGLASITERICTQNHLPVDFYGELTCYLTDVKMLKWIIT
jgi:hypothetical protein